MTLKLNMGTEPEGLEAKTYGIGEDVVRIGDYRLSIEDFLEVAHYVLTNTDLRENDPRLRFIKSVNFLIKAPGYNTGAIRLFSTLPPVQVEDVPKCEVEGCDREATRRWTGRISPEIHNTCEAHYLCYFPNK